MTEATGGIPSKREVKKHSEKAIESKPKLPDGRDAYVFDPEKWETRVRERHGITSMEELVRLTKWHKTYSGKVPESWAEAWYNIEQDLKNPAIKITDTQVFAAIEYPHWQVQQALGMNRKLSSLQLDALALTHYHSIFTFEEVLTAQDKLGLDYQSAKTARLIFSAADNVMIEKAKLEIPLSPEIIV